MGFISIELEKHMYLHFWHIYLLQIEQQFKMVAAGYQRKVLPTSHTSNVGKTKRLHAINGHTNSNDHE